jgi:hypothetical protein
VLYALRYPYSFAVLLVTFLVGVTARGLAQRLVSGARRPAWVRANSRRRSVSWLKPYIDAYGCIGAALGGAGWGAPVDISDPRNRSRGRRVVQLLVGPLALGGLGVGLLAVFRAWTHQTISGSGLGSVLTGSAWVTGSSPHHAASHFRYVLPFGQVAVFLAGVELLAMGVLAILPIPPLDGGKLLFALAPRSPGWQKVRFRLDEENWGLLLLLFLALPVLFRRVLLVSLLANFVDPLVRLIA